MVRLLAVLVLGCLVLLAAPAAAEPKLIDDFEDLTGWSTQSSEGTRVWIVQEPGHTGMGMRIGYDLNSGGGWVLVRKTFSLPLPENYVLRAVGIGFVILAYLEFQIVRDLERYRGLTLAYALLSSLFFVTIVLQAFVRGFNGALWFWWLNGIVTGAFAVALFATRRRA